MTMSIEGQHNAATILDSARALYGEGMWPLAIAVALAGIVMPLVKIVGMIAVLLPMQLGLRPSWLVAGFRLVEKVQTWAMMEVYLLGVIVAYVKLQDLAHVELGVSAIAFVATILLLAAADARFDPHTIWRRLAPRVRSIPNSRIRWATVIEKTLKMTKEPTNREMPAKARRAIVRKPRLSLMSLALRSAFSSPVSTRTDCGMTLVMLSRSDSGDAGLAGNRPSTISACALIACRPSWGPVRAITPSSRMHDRQSRATALRIRACSTSS